MSRRTYPRQARLSAAPVFIQTGPQWRFTAKAGLGGLGAYNASLLNEGSYFDASDVGVPSDAQTNLDQSTLNFDTNFFSDDTQNIGDSIQGGTYDPNFYGAASGSSDIASGIASFFKNIFGAMGPQQRAPTPIKPVAKPQATWVPWAIGGGAAVLGIGAIALIASSRKK
jgi:hypothetical protein